MYVYFTVLLAWRERVREEGGRKERGRKEGGREGGREGKRKGEVDYYYT